MRRRQGCSRRDRFSPSGGGVLPPRIPSAHRLWSNATAPWRVHSAEHVIHRAWVMLSVGLDISMLHLHTQTLGHVVDGFLVTESTSTFTRNAPKPARVTEHLAAGKFPAAVAPKIHVKIVDLERAVSTGHCSTRAAGYPRTSCVDEWQRYSLFGLLLQHAQPHDVALLADTDEIARPEVVDMLRSCFPFNPEINDAVTNKYILRATHYEFGMHCRRHEWNHGPHAFTAGYLFKRFHRTWQLQGDGPVEKEQSEATAFSGLRGEGGSRTPTIFDAAWHLSTFGTAAAIRAKFKSWTHANTFLSPSEQQQHAISRASVESKGQHAPARTRSSQLGFKPNGYENASLSLERLGRCARHCIDPYPKPMFPPAGVRQTVPPCDPNGPRASKGARGGAADVAMGTLLAARPGPAELPAAFFEPQFERLLFGWFAS